MPLRPSCPGFLLHQQGLEQGQRQLAVVLQAAANAALSLGLGQQELEAVPYGHIQVLLRILLHYCLG